MGAKQSTNKEHIKVLTDEESEQIKQLFNSIREAKVANLRKLWHGKVDQHMEQLIINYLSKSNKKTTISFHDFEKLFAHLVRGTIDDKADILIDMWTDFERTEPISRSVVQQYVESMIISYIMAHANSKWKDSSKSQIQLLADSLCSGLPAEVTYQNLCSWIANSPKLSAVQASVLGKLYKTPTIKQRIIPTCVNKNIPSILDIAMVMFINASLPAAYRDEWRVLFSSSAHGESFSKFLGFVANAGPSVVIVRDKQGYVFGGFATHSWALGPNYVGDENSFLFRLKPTMHIYDSTHYNNHYQYLNVQQQTMPNGLGMGGQFGYWGLWLDAEYGTGQSSETCTTYRNFKMLSGIKEFEVDHLEAWAVGPLPQLEDDAGNQRSILDTNLEAQAMMEMVGKTRHSEGLREPEEPE